MLDLLNTSPMGDHRDAIHSGVWGLLACHLGHRRQTLYIVDVSNIE